MYEKVFEELLSMNGGYWAQQFSCPVERAWFKVGFLAWMDNGAWLNYA